MKQSAEYLKALKKTEQKEGGDDRPDALRDRYRDGEEKTQKEVADILWDLPVLYLKTEKKIMQRLVQRNGKYV